MRKSMTLTRIVIVTMAAFTLTGIVLAHGGGLDSQGGHHNRKEGGYHFHQGPLAGQSFSSKDAAAAALRAYYDQQPNPNQSKPKEPDRKPERDSKSVSLTADQRLDVLVRLLETRQLLPRGDFQKEIEREIERQRRKP